MSFDRKKLLDVKISSERIDKMYNISKEILGKGNFGMIVCGEDKVTDQKRAIKIIKKSKLEKEKFDLKQLSNEFNIMVQMDHPNVIRLYEVYEDAKYIYFVMELLEGRDLFEALKDDAFDLNEKRMRSIFYQLMKGISYLHKNGIAHRDIKPQNIMFVNKKSDQIKIIDFGVSKYFFHTSEPKKEITLRTKTGSLYYLPPEIINGKYDYRCDIWSAGVMLYMMIAGEPPFYDANPDVVLKKIQKMEFSFTHVVWKSVSPELRDLICNMVTPREKRYTAEDVLNHPWMRMNMEKSDYEVQLTLVKAFFRASHLSRLFREMVAAIASEGELSNLGGFFVELDEDGDGAINREELIDGLQKKLTFFDNEVIEAIRKGYEPNAKIHYNGFLAVMSMITTSSNIEARVEKIFAKIDVKKQGKIYPTDLIRFNQKNDCEEDKEEEILKYQEHFKEVDTENKGFLTLDDVKRLVTQK